MSQKHVLHICERQRPPQQRIVIEVNLPDREVIGGAPVGIDFVEKLWRESVGFHGS